MNWGEIGQTVAKAAPMLGSLLGGPAGGAAGSLVANAFGADADPEKVMTAINGDPEAQAKLKKLEQEHQRELRSMMLEAETSRLAEINKTMRAETQADDGYVRRWRPTFGYVASVTWALQIIGLVWAMVANPDNAANIIEAVTSLTPMWGIALAVLGINVSKRSQDKQVKAGQQPSGGLLGRLVGGNNE